MATNNQRLLKIARHRIDISSRVLLLRQIWNIKCSLDNLSNDNKNTGVSRIWYFKNSSFWHFKSCFVLKQFFRYWEKNMNWKSTIIWQNNWRYYTLLNADELWRTTALIYVDNGQYYTVSRRTPDKEVWPKIIIIDITLSNGVEGLE